MSGIVKGAAAMREAVKPRKELPKLNFFSLKDGESVVAQFIQEIDAESEHYREDLGLGFLAYVLSPPTPDGWKYRYIVNEDNEHLLEQVGHWDRKGRLYINLLVERDGTRQVELWDASKAVLRQLLEWSDDLGGITHQKFKITRSGSGTSTSYIFMPKGDADEIGEVELVDAEERLLNLLTEEDVKRFAQDDVDDQSTGENVEWLT